MVNKLSKKLKGRIFGLKTRDGRSFNARLVRETDCYITINDNNMLESVKISKANIASVNCG